MNVSGRGSPINLSCLWKRQETAQLLCLPLCHNWYNTRDKDLTSSICLHPPPSTALPSVSLSNSPSESFLQSRAGMSGCCKFYGSLRSFSHPSSSLWHISFWLSCCADSILSLPPSFLHWLQWLHHWLLWPSDSLNLTFRHRVHLLFVCVNTARGIWSMHGLSIGNTARPVLLCRRSLEDT